MNNLYKLALLSVLLALSLASNLHSQQFAFANSHKFKAGKSYALFTKIGDKPFFLTPNNRVLWWQWAKFANGQYMNANDAHKKQYNPVIYIQQVSGSTTNWFIKSTSVSDGVQSYLVIDTKVSEKGTSQGFFATFQYLKQNPKYQSKFTITNGEIRGVTADQGVYPILYADGKYADFSWASFDRINKNPAQSKIQITSINLEKWRKQYSS